MTTVEIEIEILELAADLIASNPDCSRSAITTAFDRLHPDAETERIERFVQRTLSGFEMYPDRPDYADRKLGVILNRLNELRGTR